MKNDLKHKKRIVKFRNSFYSNWNEHSKGWQRGKSDKLNGLPFGQSCSKYTAAFCNGYRHGWKYGDLYK